MNVSYQDVGRINQKRRTRTAVLEAAAGLVRAGRTPSVAEAAEAAAVSRATAYRYFPTQESLLVEVATTSRPPLTDDLLGPLANLDDAEARVNAVVEALTDFMVEHEPGLRTMLKLSLERSLEDRADTPVREGRRVRYLEQAMAPLREKLSEHELERLNAALGIVIGIEALVVLRDVYGLEPAEARSLMRWAASVLFKAATEGAARPADADGRSTLERPGATPRAARPRRRPPGKQ
jgi:AcrR family transcriptional regulator